MPANLTLIDRLQNQLPTVFNARVNPNWNALVTAIGQSDQNIADLLVQIQQQLFVVTATGQYLDNLASNVGIVRPPLVGVQDAQFRNYIPILAYQPKQVKLILDQLLNLFYSQTSTTAYIQSSIAEPFALVDGWKLSYTLDNINTEYIIFSAADFTDIGAATAAEVAASINRQAQYSYAAPFFDDPTQNTYLQIFSNTLGSKSALLMLGGLANLAFQFEGYNKLSGGTIGTGWIATKIGDLMTFTWNGDGTNPMLEYVQAGDLVFMLLNPQPNPTNPSAQNNVGSFVVESVDLSNNSFSFRNTFGAVGTYHNATLLDVHFMTADKAAPWKEEIRALVWETEPNDVVVEIPATPPVVRRNLIGSWHLNGLYTPMTSLNSSSSLSVVDSSKWPTSAEFLIQEEIRVDADTQYLSRLGGDPIIYTYTSNTGNTLSGITPNLPDGFSSDPYTILTVIRNNGTVTVTTSVPHDYTVGENVVISGVTSATIVTMNGVFQISSVTSNTFAYSQGGDNGTGTGGTSTVDRPGIADSGSIVYLRSSELNTGMLGNYVWDTAATFVLSSTDSTIVNEILAGTIVKYLTVSSDNMPNAQGLLIFDFGLPMQEGPVTYYYTASPYVLALDPAYIFKYNHVANSSVVLLDQKGPHVMSGFGTEYPPYITSPVAVRKTLEGLIESVISAGIYIDFLVRYPTQFYAAVDVYDSGNPDLIQVTGQE